MSRITLAAFLILMVAAVPLFAASPQIAFTVVPPYGSFAQLQGKMTGGNPPDWQVAVMINISGLGAWSKPYCDVNYQYAVLVPIQPDGTWTTPYATGGVDDTATEIAAYLVPTGTLVPCYLGVDGLPAALQGLSVSTVIATRAMPRQVTFGGLTWEVKTNRVPLGPGPCLFSDSTDNVWVDNLGALHLKITNRNGQWYCAEVYTDQVLGYGSYSFKVQNPPCALDPNVVLGLFTYNDIDSSYAHREIDIEFSKWAQPNNPNCEQFVIQPYSQPGHIMQFPFTAGPDSVNSFSWRRNRVLFKAATSAGMVVKQWDDMTDVPPSSSQNQNARINLWYTGAPPSSEIETVIDAFQFR
ncbi:MAG: hypothetical protein C5B51_16800 [Terriglobia bacterium]|nr:MAG: hypothetical protein C5B51_16800 [Terriglobia bacterium]